MESAREVRRRKIVERGSDRLAFITGQARTLPLPQPSPSTSTPQISPPPQDQTNAAVAIHGEDDATGSVFPGSKTRGEDELRNGSSVVSEVEEPLVASKFQVPPNTGGPSVVEVEPPRIPLHPRIFTATTINSSIAATENIRLLCSAAIALLAILSHGPDSLGGNIVKWFISSRPLYLVLLTDITIVLGWLLFWNRGGGEKAVRETSNNMEGGGWADRLGMALEMALVFQKVMSGIFKDCSVYAVLLVCGLTLLQ